MMEKYVKPELEIIIVNNVGIVTTSDPEDTLPEIPYIF